MSSLTMKQKIILGIIICLMLIVIGIYGYISLNQNDELDIGEMINNEMDSNNQITNQNANNIDKNAGDVANSNQSFRSG